MTDAGGQPPSSPAGVRSGSAERLSPPPAAVLDDALADAEAVGFVHVGADADAAVRYLLGEPVLDGHRAFVYAGGTATVLAPGASRGGAEEGGDDGAGDRRDDRDAGAGRDDGDRDDGATDRTRGVDRRRLSESPSGVAAAAVLDERTAASGAVLVPSPLPHDAAVYLERAGYEPTVTAAVERSRASKTVAERAAAAATQRAAAAGVDRAAELLSVGDDPAPTAAAVRQAVATATVDAGAADVRRVGVAIGPDPEGGEGSETDRDGGTDLSSNGSAPIDPGATVTVAATPRGPRGYYGHLVRTFVVGGEGGGSGAPRRLRGGSAGRAGRTDPGRVGGRRPRGGAGGAVGVRIPAGLASGRCPRRRSVGAGGPDRR